MADPVTWAIIGVTVAAASSIGGSVMQHKQGKANAEMQEDQMKYNQRLQQNEARRVERVNMENVRRQRMAAAEAKAQQRAAMGKSGAAMTSGSPLAVLGQTAADEELKIQDSHYGGYMQARQHEEQAKMFGYQAKVAKANKPSDLALGLNIAGTVGNAVASGMSVYGAGGAGANAGGGK